MAGEMTKEDRKRWILKFLVETGLSLPPSAIYHNMTHTTWNEDTTQRLLSELVDDGLVARDPEKHGYYEATQAGRREIDSTNGT
jgi:predicted transcriptional regulator